MRLLLRAAPVVAIAALAAVPARADPLQDQVFAAMKATSTADVGFTQILRVEQTGSAAKEYVSRYDPAAPAASRWTLMKVDGRAPTPKEIAAAIKQRGKGKPPSYAEMKDWFGRPATRVGQTATAVTYRFTGLPAGTIKIGSHDASADTVIDAVVRTDAKAPYVQRVRIASDKPFRMMLVARLERFVMTASYAPLGDGRPFPTAVDADMGGSIMGKSGSLRTAMRYTDVRAR